ncbi:EAL domain-containing protein [Arthrobacter oryzae]|uniref:EAL domain-containing protein n=1 Tax=Arthrobacter oryzae TaxID=409290 RepID=A0A3N0C8S9_9MICC|nr:EAL domain-containing protein [Arthrobacter oryzae]RNL59169.1 EAL domain-containing protein [Arthrobacter oryzae]
MSIEPSSLSRPENRARIEDPPGTRPEAGSAPGIRRQAAEIIGAVLASSVPEQAAARDQLRQCLAAHPGRPEEALVEHLIALRSLTPRTGGPPAHPTVGGVAPPQPLTDPASPSPSPQEIVRSRIEAVLQDRKLLTAFQPICDLPSGGVIGAQALTWFLGDTGDGPVDWFAGARSVRLGSDLEFAALESALTAAMILPAHLYVALKLSPATCLDPLLPGLLEASGISPGRVVLELTEALTIDQPAALFKALAPLRRRGVRLAIDHIGSYVASSRHIRELRPDIIKLDRTLVAGIDTDALHYSLCEAIVGFAENIGATVTAQGIETPAELTTVSGAGATAGQGYLLGLPTTRPEDWNRWTPAPSQPRTPPGPDGIIQTSSDG